MKAHGERMMRCHAERGDIGAAMAAYDRCRGVLAEAAGSQRLSPETEELIADSHPAAASSAVRGRLAARCPAGQQAGLDGSARPRLNAPCYRVAAGWTATARRCGCVSLPLRTIGEERDDGLALGLAEEISAGLSRFRWISCVPATLVAAGPRRASGAVVAEAATAHGPARGGPDPGRHDPARPRPGADHRPPGRHAGGGEIVWAGRFDRDMTDLLALQDELGAAIVAQVDPELMQHEGRRTSRPARTT